MTSILTNTSAKTALQVLQQTQANLNTTQRHISTGQRISTAADNAAYWSVGTKLSSDSTMLGAVSDALNLGSSIVGSATTGMTNAISVVTQIQAKVTAAKSAGVDVSATNSDIAALQAELRQIAKSASFNGQNLLNITGTANTVNLVSSYYRDSTGAAAVGTISINSANTALYNTGTVNSVGYLATSKSTLTTIGVGPATEAANTTSTGTPIAYSSTTTAVSTTFTVIGAALTQSTAWAVGNGSGAGVVLTVRAATAGTTNAATNMSQTVTIALNRDLFANANFGPGNASVIDDNQNSTATATTGATPIVTYKYDQSARKLVIDVDTWDTNANSAKRQEITVNDLKDAAPQGILDSTTSAAAVQANTSFANLGVGTLLVANTNATTAQQYDYYIALCDSVLTSLRSAASSLGSNSSLITQTQSFTTALQNSIDTGVSSLIDANLEEESTRLQALQTQQSLGVQALSIANQSTQSILSLFRGG